MQNPYTFINDMDISGNEPEILKCKDLSPLPFSTLFVICASRQGTEELYVL